MSTSTKELFSIIGEQLVQLKQFNNLIELLKKDNESKAKEIAEFKARVRAAEHSEAEEDAS